MNSLATYDEIIISLEKLYIVTFPFFNGQAFQDLYTYTLKRENGGYIIFNIHASKRICFETVKMPYEKSTSTTH